jgi:hypothetical protein
MGYNQHAAPYLLSKLYKNLSKGVGQLMHAIVEVLGLLFAILAHNPEIQYRLQQASCSGLSLAKGI